MTPFEPQRVLLMSYEYPPLGGGGGVIVRDLAQELAGRVAVTVLTSGRSDLPRRERDGQVEIVRVPVLLRTATAVASLPSMLSFFPSSLWAGRRLIRERCFDLVHSAFAIPTGPSALLLARTAGLPHVLSILGGDIYDPSKRLSPHRTPILKQTVRWVLRGSDRVVADSHDLAQRTREIYGVADIDRIPLAVKPVPFEPIPRTELGVGEHDLVLVTVGRLIARKGLDQLIDVVAELEVPRIRLLVVGEGPLRGALEARARRAGAADRVRFAGFVSEERKWQILAASDLYVSTALHEGFGIVFLEAMASRCPVVCYDCGGPRDFLREEFSRLVPVGDRDGIRREIARLAAEPGLRARMGEAGAHAALDYHVDRLAERYLEVYRQCLGAAASRREGCLEGGPPCT